MLTAAVIILSVIVGGALLIGGFVAWLYWMAEHRQNPFR